MIAERFSWTLKNNINKNMAAMANNVYIGEF